MAEIAQRVLMNEFKQLSKEKWTNIEVSHYGIPEQSPSERNVGAPG
jgi:ubiquitin-conjugating enzyme E2 R